VERRKRLRSFVILTMFLERTWLLLAGVWIMASGAASAQLTIAGLLALWALYSTGNGCATIVWTNLMARVVPITLRGRLAGWGGGISALTGIAMAMLVRYLVEALGLRMGYGLGFAVGGLLLTATSLVFLVVRESDTPSPAAESSLRDYVAALPAILSRDRAFRWFIVARMLWAVAATATPFYTVYAIARFGVGPGQVAWLAVASSLGWVAGSFLGGAAGDAKGYRVVLVASSLALVVAPLAAMAGGAIAIVAAVFVVDALGQSTGMLSGINTPLELAPAGQVAGYLAVNTIVLGPVRTLVPVAAGALAEWRGYPFLFGVCAVAGLSAALAFVLRVPEPRRRHPYEAKMTEDYLEARARRGDSACLDTALAEVEPEERDRLQG
jgi:Na+/melibiose symporter-like transporter